jgi:hypothetical protein
VREGIGERSRVELPFKEEDDVHRQVGDCGVADIAADFEPCRVQWFDHPGRHDELRSAAQYYAAAEFRGIGDAPKIRLLIGGGIGLDPEILQHGPSNCVFIGISRSTCGRDGSHHRAACQAILTRVRWDDLDSALLQNETSF